MGQGRPLPGRPRRHDHGILPQSPATGDQMSILRKAPADTSGHRHGGPSEGPRRPDLGNQRPLSAEDRRRPQRRHLPRLQASHRLEIAARMAPDCRRGHRLQARQKPGLHPAGPPPRGLGRDPPVLHRRQWRAVPDRDECPGDPCCSTVPGTIQLTHRLTRPEIPTQTFTRHRRPRVIPTSQSAAATPLASDFRILRRQQHRPGQPRRDGHRDEQERRRWRSPPARDRRDGWRSFAANAELLRLTLDNLKPRSPGFNPTWTP